MNLFNDENPCILKVNNNNQQKVDYNHDLDTLKDSNVSNILSLDNLQKYLDNLGSNKIGNPSDELAKFCLNRAYYYLGAAIDARNDEDVKSCLENFDYYMKKYKEFSPFFKCITYDNNDKILPNSLSDTHSTGYPAHREYETIITNQSSTEKNTNE